MNPVCLCCFVFFFISVCNTPFSVYVWCFFLFFSSFFFYYSEPKSNPYRYIYLYLLAELLLLFSVLSLSFFSLKIASLSLSLLLYTSMYAYLYVGEMECMLHGAFSVNFFFFLRACFSFSFLFLFFFSFLRGVRALFRRLQLLVQRGRCEAQHSFRHHLPRHIFLPQTMPTRGAVGRPTHTKCKKKEKNVKKISKKKVLTQGHWKRQGLPPRQAVAARNGRETNATASSMKDTDTEEQNRKIAIRPRRKQKEKANTRNHPSTEKKRYSSKQRITMKRENSKLILFYLLLRGLFFPSHMVCSRVCLFYMSGLFFTVPCGVMLARKFLFMRFFFFAIPFCLV